MSSSEGAYPTANCGAESCKNCPLTKEIQCHHRPLDFLWHLAILAPVIATGGIGLWYSGKGILTSWILQLILFSVFIKTRVLCSHCPRYVERGDILRCWAGFGIPKLWRYQTGTLSVGERIVFFASHIIVWSYPILFMFLASDKLFFLCLYTASLALFYVLKRNFFCKKCINFACPLNCTPPGVRRYFY